MPVSRRPSRQDARRRRRGPWWGELPLQDLLDVRICNLDLDVEGTALEERLERLDAELASAGLVFRPYVWLSTDWYAPDGLTGFAVPFYLAHPRLARLERQQMLEVEGGTHDWCMRLLRHETGHALDNAYRLRRRKGYRALFGSASEPYDETYLPTPSSRNHVHNLDHWYSQSHPVEDFAETFAVWLRPGGHWRRRYQGWPVMEKLRWVDGLMGEIADRTPPLRTRERVDTLRSVRTTLREHYAEKRARYEVNLPSPYDRALRRIFAVPARSAPGSEAAASFLRRHRAGLVRRVGDAADQHPYVVDQLLKELVPRCRLLGLRLAGSELAALLDTAALLGALTQGLVAGRRRRFAR